MDTRVLQLLVEFQCTPYMLLMSHINHCIVSVLSGKHLRGYPNVHVPVPKLSQDQVQEKAFEKTKLRAPGQLAPFTSI